MDTHTIDGFWTPLLESINQTPFTRDILGWTFQSPGLGTFKEAPLTYSTRQFGDDADPSSSSILLISAPGAVGKSTLAKQIAFRTGSIYVDLATSEPVGGNFLSGGLARSGQYASWQNGTMTAMIDGLDEAILKAQKEGLEAFLSDVAELSIGRTVPTVIFGRTVSIEDASAYLEDKMPGEVAVLEIGYYDEATALEFAEETLKVFREERGNSHPIVDRQALNLLLSGLREQTATDGNRFAGYAPVLQAVAARVNQYDNPNLLVSELISGSLPPITLQSVVQSILDRERNKLTGLVLLNNDLKDQLYLPEEQLDRLVAKVYGVAPPELPQMSAEDAERYTSALETWVQYHPFYDGGSGTPSAVFRAAICAKALESSSASERAIRMELGRSDAADPFLYIFYVNQDTSVDPAYLPETHIGIIYSSIRASLARGETASLFVTDEADFQVDSQLADVEIDLVRNGSVGLKSLFFKTGISGPILFGAHVRDAQVLMPRARIEIGHTAELVLVSPIDIQCRDLAISAEKVIVENPPESTEYAAYLQADEYSGTSISSVPLRRNQAKLFVSWPGAESYPWRDVRADISTARDGNLRLEEALRRFRMFVVTCKGFGRNLGPGQSSRKIESGRMTKGTGQSVLDSMVEARILHREQSWYYLDTDRLAELTQMNYADCMEHRFSEAATAFVSHALGGS